MLLEYLKEIVRRGAVELMLRPDCDFPASVAAVQREMGWSSLPVREYTCLKALLADYQRYRVHEGSPEAATGFSPASYEWASPTAVERLFQILRKAANVTEDWSNDSFRKVFAKTAELLSRNGLEYQRIFIGRLAYRWMHYDGRTRGFRDPTHLLNAVDKVLKSPALLEELEQGRLAAVVTGAIESQSVVVAGSRYLAGKEIVDFLQMVYDKKPEKGGVIEKLAVARRGQDRTPDELANEFILGHGQNHFQNRREWLDKIRAWYRFEYVGKLWNRQWCTDDTLVTQAIYHRLVALTLIIPCKYVTQQPEVMESHLERFVASMPRDFTQRLTSEEAIYLAAARYIRVNTIFNGLDAVLGAEALTRWVFAKHTHRAGLSWPHEPTWAIDNTVGPVTGYQFSTLHRWWSELRRNPPENDTLQGIRDWLLRQSDLAHFNLPLGNSIPEATERNAICCGIAKVLYTALMHEPDNSETSDVCQGAEVQTTEEKVSTNMGLKLQANYTINGKSVEGLSTGAVALMIADEERELAELGKIANKPRRVIAEIEQRTADLKEFVAYLDDQDAKKEAAKTDDK